MISQAPIPHWFPFTLVALAAWDDESLQVFEWTSPNVAAPSGPHPDLLARFGTAVEAAIRRRDRSSASELKALREEVDHWKAQVQSLADQAYTLIAERNHLHRDLEIEKAKVKSMISTGTPTPKPTGATRPALRDVSRPGPGDET